MFMLFIFLVLSCIVHMVYCVTTYVNSFAYSSTRHQVNTKVVLNSLKYILGTFFYIACLTYGYTYITRYIISAIIIYYTVQYYNMLYLYDTNYYYIYDANYIYILLISFCHIYGSGDYLVDFVTFIPVFSISIIDMD